MIPRVLIFCLLTASAALADFNKTIVDQVRTMPAGGGYATNLKAHAALADSVRVHDSVRIQPELAMPAYCSGATYLVFLKTLQALHENGTISLSHETWAALVPRLRPDGKDTLPDGESVWGRWNANGPGTARLFHQLGLGRNFTEFSAARPGDFMKVFWTDAVGKKENGHSVVFLGLENVEWRRNCPLLVEQSPGRFWGDFRPTREDCPGYFFASRAPRKNLRLVEAFSERSLSRKSAHQRIKLP